MPRDHEPHEIEMELLSPRDEDKHEYPENVYPLVKAYADATGSTECQSLLAAQDLTAEKLKEAFITELNKNIQGGLIQALVIDTFAYFSSFMVIVSANPALSRMSRLNMPLKMLLSGAASIGSAITVIPVAKSMDENEGKNALLIIRGISVAGGIGLVLFATQMDFADIDSFDLRYISLFSLFGLCGVSVSSFLINTNLILWTPVRHLGLVLGLFSGFGGSALGASQLLLEWLLQDVSLPIIYSVSTGILLLGGIGIAKFYALSPYSQLLKMNIAPEAAKEIAKLVGQEKFPVINDAGFMSELKKLIPDIRTITLAASFLNSYGLNVSSVFRSSIILTKDFQFSASTAAIITGTGALCIPLARLAAGRPMDVWDSSKGTYTYLLAAAAITACSLIGAIGKERIGLVSHLIIKYLIDIATGVAGGAGSRLFSTWSEPKNPDLPPYNLGGVQALASVVSQLGAVIIPALIGLFISHNTEKGSYNSFYLTAGIAIATTIMVYLTNLHQEQSLKIKAQHVWCRLFNPSAPAHLDLSIVDTNENRLAFDQK